MLKELQGYLEAMYVLLDAGEHPTIVGIHRRTRWSCTEPTYKRVMRLRLRSCTFAKVTVFQSHSIKTRLEIAATMFKALRGILLSRLTAWKAWVVGSAHS